jgi:hypothetical protein
VAVGVVRMVAEVAVVISGGDLPAAAWAVG